MDFSKEQPLGTPALAYSLLSRCVPVFALFLVLGAFAVYSAFASGPIHAAARYFWILPAAAFVVGAALATVVYLEYASYRFSLGPYALLVRKGLINIAEVSVPFNKIQDVDIDRPLAYRVFGLSRLVILTAGRDDTKQADESEGILDMLDAKTAEALQAELLRRSAVQVVREDEPRGAGLDGPLVRS